MNWFIKNFISLTHRRIRVLIPILLTMHFLVACENSLAVYPAATRFVGLQGEGVSLSMDANGKLNADWASGTPPYTISVFNLSDIPSSIASSKIADPSPLKFIALTNAEVSHLTLGSAMAQESVQSTSYIFPRKLDDASYYLVQYSDSKAKTPASFLVKAGLPLVTAIVSKIDGSGVTLSWASPVGANGYEIEDTDRHIISSSSEAKFVIPNYDNTLAYNFCVRSTRGTFKASRCTSFQVAPTLATVQAVDVTTSLADGYYAAGTVLPLTVHFSGIVNIPNGSQPVLVLQIGANKAYARYVSGSGTRNIVFNYVVHGGDAAASIQALRMMSMNDAPAMLDPKGTAVSLVLPEGGSGFALSDHSAIGIDTLAPTPADLPLFSGTVSATPVVSVSFMLGTDLHFKQNHAKLCSSRDCLTACTPEVLSTTSPMALSGSNGQTLYACVQSEDSAGNLSAWVASLNSLTIDTTVPAVSFIDSPSATGIFKAGDNVAINIHFTGNVYVTNGDSFALALAVGGTPRSALYTGGGGTSVLAFSYTVQAGDTAALLDCASASALTLGGSGLLKSAGGSNASLILPSPGSPSALAGTTALIIDTTAPTDPSSPGFSGTVSSSLTFPFSWSASSDAHLDHYNSKICSANDCATGCTSPLTSVSASRSMSGVDGGIYYGCVQAQDLVGNRSAWVPTLGTLKVDTTAPVVTAISSPSGSGYFKVGDVIPIIILFSENVTVSAGGSKSLTLETGLTDEVLSYTSGSGTQALSFNYTVQAGDTTESLDIASTGALILSGGATIKDAAGNNAVLTLPVPGSAGALFPAKSLTIDTTLPIAPVAVHFDALESASLNANIAWTDSTDTHFKRQAIKMCTASDCTTGCGPSSYRDVSPAVLAGTSGSTYYACVRGEDLAGNVSAWVPSTATLHIDTTAPTVSLVSSPTANGYYGIGSNIDVTVQFSENVFVTGDANLLLETGSTDRNAPFVSGSGTNTLSFRYLVQSGDTSADLDNQSATALSLLASSSIKDAAGNSAVLTLPSPGLATGKALVIDTSSPSSPGSPGFGSSQSASTSLSLAFANSVDTNFRYHTAKVCTSPDCATGCGGVVTSVSTPVTLSGSNGTSYFGCVQGQDLAGNTSGWIPSTLSVTVDTTAPTALTITSPKANGIYKLGDTLDITIQFSEPVIVTNGTDLKLTMATGGGPNRDALYMSGSASDTLLFRYTVQPGDTSPLLEQVLPSSLSVGATGAIKDSAGNNAVLATPTLGSPNSLSGSKTFVIDTTVPSNPSSVVFVLAQTNSTSLAISWSPSTDTHFAQHSVKICTANDCSTGCLTPISSVGSSASATGTSGQTYYACVRGEDTACNYSAWVSSGASSTIDQTAPSISTVSATTVDGFYKTGNVVVVTVKFSEPVTLSGAGSINLLLETGVSDQTAVFNTQSAADTLSFNYTVVAGDTSADLDVQSSAALTLGGSRAIKDAAGNSAVLTLPIGVALSSLASQKNLVIDTTLPSAPSTVTLPISPSTSASFAVSWTDGSDTNLLQHNIKACTANNCATACTGLVSAPTGPKTISGSSGTTYYACVQAQDKSGNLSAWIPSASTLTIDSAAPVVSSITSSAADGYYKVGDVIPIAVTFSKIVNATNVSDITLTLETGAADASIPLTSGSGTTTLNFTYTVQAGHTTADLDSVLTTGLSVGATGTIKDAAGNNAGLSLPIAGAAGSLATNKNIRIDTTSPTAPSSVGFSGAVSGSTSFLVSYSASTDTNFRYHNVKACTFADCATGCSGIATSVGASATLSGVNGSSYYACVQGQDLSGNTSAWINSSATISIDTAAPTVSNVSSSAANGYYKIGAVLPITVQFSEPVYVIGGSITLTLETGATDPVVAYASGSGTNTLTFNYTLASPHTAAALEVNSSAAITLGGGTIKDAAGNNATLTLPTSGASSLSGQKSIVIDTTLPTIPTAIGFASSHSATTNFNVQWTQGSDTNFSTSNIKMCTANDCTTGCGSVTTAASSPASKTGAFGQTYYACIQSLDLAANASVYTASSSTITLDAAPAFTGVASGQVLGSWSDGTGKLELTFNATPPASGITNYRIYYSASSTIGSFNFNSPIATINFGDSKFDAVSSDTKILVSVPIATLQDGYYVVRYYDPTGAYVDSNTSVSSLVSVLIGQPGYILVPKLYSGLAYDYYMMKYEASLSASGVNPGSDIVSTVVANVASCAYKFQQGGTIADATCGTKNITKLAQSVSGVAPQASIPWSSSFYACRNATTANARVRLPTAEEWRRASKWIGTSYSTMWSVYSDNAATHCNVSNASAANTGNASACLTGLGALDMAGNLREWVDSRVAQYSISGNSESRFSYGPTIARSISNGLDNIVQRLQTLDPGASGMALTMGADFKTPSYAGQKQYGAEVQTWVVPTTSDTAIGFRCMGVRADTSPTMDQIALPDEPKYSLADIPAGTPASWKIPENLFIKDNKWETLAITINGNLTDSVAEGTVSLTWTPWTKTSCNTSGTCTASDNGLVYKVYRFTEPNLESIRPSVPWALVGTGSAYGTSGADKPLSPLAVDLTGARLFNGSTTDGTLIATVSNCSASSLSNCTFTDSITASTGFSVAKIYDYILVVEDALGNAITPSVQRYRSPYFVGAPSVASAAAFRMEPRYRRASVFLVDEYYQQAQTRPQIMVHVPMDISGLDHDFFVQKYEASQFGGTVVNATPVASSNWPLQGSVSAWVSNAALCYDKFLQTGTFDLTGCGDGTQVNATTATIQSKQATASLVNLDQGASWKACRNTGITDGNGSSYYLNLATDGEWNKAADWGDTDQNGTIDISAYSANVGVSIPTLEWNGTGADSITVRCHTDNTPASAYPSNDPQTANCRSRYGVADMVGNVWEWTSGQQLSAAGQDNGTDGLWYGVTLPGGASNISAFKMDLMRAYPSSSALSTIADNSDFYNYASSLGGSIRGGNWGYGAGSGRWTLAQHRPPSLVAWYLGQRCSL